MTQHPQPDQPEQAELLDQRQASAAADLSYEQARDELIDVVRTYLK